MNRVIKTDRIDEVVVPASALVERAMKLDLRPEERIMILWDAMAQALQAFPPEEHAEQLALAIKCGCFCAHVDPNVARTEVPSVPRDDGTPDHSRMH